MLLFTSAVIGQQREHVVLACACSYQVTHVDAPCPVICAARSMCVVWALLWEVCVG